MKLFFKVVAFLSIGILLIAILEIFSAYVSLKYEVEEPIAIGRSDEMVIATKTHLENLIRWLWLIIGYSIVVIVVTVKAIVSKYFPVSK